MRLKALSAVAIIGTLLSGCGGGDPRGQAVSRVSEAQSCIGCHPDDPSPGTGSAVAQEWLSSRHATANAAGCADCHEPAAGHPNECSKCHAGGSPTGYEVTRTPDASGKCFKCHGLQHPSDVMVRLAPQHFGNMTATASSFRPRASYYNWQYQGKCRACHNPHKIDLTDQHVQFAKSAHANPRGAAWVNYDFKTMPACVRCHTTKGFVQFATSDWTIPTAGYAAGDLTRSVLGCDTCHTSYDFRKSQRKIAAFVAPYNGGASPAHYPDVEKSNLCIPCHAGRESRDTVNAVPDAALTNKKFLEVNPHYRVAAGLMYMKVGFISFTSLDAPVGTSTYGKSLSPDNVSTPDGVVGGVKSTHRNFGTPRITGDSHNPSVFVPGVMDSNGPCVTCHMNAAGLPGRVGAGHSVAIGAEAYRQVCHNCHLQEKGVAIAADGSNFQQIFLEPQKEAFETALDLMEHLLLQRYHISFDESAAPYFFDEDLPLVAGKKQPVTDWTRRGAVNGRKLLGACFNFNLLKREPGAYAHARSYTRRLIYDSIDFLDNGIMDRSTGTTAIASGVTLADGVTAAFVKDDKPFNSDGTLYGRTSEAMVYLISGSRANGWNVVERP